jgi:aspartate ammonia-lyase
MDTLVTNCIAGIRVDEARCRQNLNASTAMATLLVPHIGYDRAVAIAKAALRNGIPFSAYVAAEHPDLAPLIHV